jgi:hypothetical protein
MGSGNSSSNTNTRNQRANSNQNNQRVVENQQNVHHNQLPSDNNLHSYSDNVRQFLEQQNFKKISRERNLNLHGKLIKSRVGIDAKSISFLQDEEDKNMYWLSFNYSSTEKCKISVYYCANQTTNSDGLPSYFTIPPDLPSASVIKVKKGVNKSFQGEEQACFDVQKYKGMPLFNSSTNYFPCII